MTHRAAQVPSRQLFRFPVNAAHNSPFSFQIQIHPIMACFCKYKREKVASFADKINPINHGHPKTF